MSGGTCVVSNNKVQAHCSTIKMAQEPNLVSGVMCLVNPFYLCGTQSIATGLTGKHSTFNVLTSWRVT